MVPFLLFELRGDTLQNAINKVIEVIMVFFMVVIIISVITQVFFRYVLGAPLGWTEEIGRFALVWLTFLGAYLTFYRVRHMSVSLLFQRVPKHLQITFYLASNVIMIVFFTYLVVNGFSYSKHMLQFYPDTLPISLGIIYSVIPIGGLLYLLYCTKEVINTFISLGKEYPAQFMGDGKGD